MPPRSVPFRRLSKATLLALAACGTTNAPPPAPPLKTAPPPAASARAPQAAAPPTAAPSVTPSATPPAAPPAVWLEVAAGARHTCARLQGGEVRCWGDGSAGQLGSPASDKQAPLAVPGLGAVKQLGAGAAHSCALTEHGAVWCWGTLPATDKAIGPAKIGGLPEIAAIAVGETMTCALHAARGQVSCWGLNKQHQLGDGSSINRGDQPQPIPRLFHASSVTAGERHGCVLKKGTPECFGENTWGQVSPLLKGRPTRRVLASISKATLAAAGTEHTCAIAGVEVHCWGHNDKGQLGVDDPGATGPVLARKLDVAPTALRAGRWHGCLLTAAGQVLCWGGAGPAAGRARLGQKPFEPVPLAGKATAISAGGDHTCAILEGGVLRCWGDDSHGQLGPGRQ